MIKRIGVESRRKIERFLGRHVHLDLRVEVSENWRRDARVVNRMIEGAGER